MGLQTETKEWSRSEDAGERPDHEFEMQVAVVEPMGNENVVHLAFPDSPDGSDGLTAITDSLRQLDEGETVVAHLPIDAVHVFDQSSGGALHIRRIDPQEQTPRI